MIFYKSKIYKQFVSCKNNTYINAQKWLESIRGHSMNWLCDAPKWRNTESEKTRKTSILKVSWWPGVTRIRNSHFDLFFTFHTSANNLVTTGENYRRGCFDNIQKNVRTIYPEETYLQLHRLCSWFMVCFILKPLPLMTEILENKLLCWMILISGVLCIFLKSEYLILDWFRKEAQCAVINMGLFSRVINMGLGRMQSPLQDVVQSLFLENRINDFTKTWSPST